MPDLGTCTLGERKFHSSLALERIEGEKIQQFFVCRCYWSGLLFRFFYAVSADGGWAMTAQKKLRFWCALGSVWLLY